jgi:hypothetical protein
MHVASSNLPGYGVAADFLSVHNVVRECSITHGTGVSYFVADSISVVLRRFVGC